MEIKDTYLKLIGKRIYNKSLNKYGMISHIEIMPLNGRYCLWYGAYYDKVDNRKITAIYDFADGDLQFVVLTGAKIYDNAHPVILNDIKAVYGNAFHDDMIRYIDYEDWQETQDKKRIDE